MSLRETTCPGCGLRMPASETAAYGGYYHASPECWSVYTEVLGREYSYPTLYGRAHQLTVDAYAVQHAGGPHPDKSVDVHLSGLCLVLEHGLAPPSVPRVLQRLASAVEEWPHLPPPPRLEAPTVFDVALAGTLEEHIEVVGAWARRVWEAWSPHHAAVDRLLRSHRAIG